MARPKKAEQAEVIEIHKGPKYKTIDVTIESVGRIYGGIPADEKILRKWIESKGLIPEETLEDKIEATKGQNEGEVEEKVQASSTVFRKDEGGIYLTDFQFKQMLRESGSVLGVFKARRGTKTLMTIGMVVEPARVRCLREMPSGVIGVLQDADGFEEFQGRVQTPMGPRSILSRKAYLEPGTLFTFQITFLENGVMADVDFLNILNHAGRFVGLGSARSRESGKFVVKEFEVAT